MAIYRIKRFGICRDLNNNHTVDELSRKEIERDYRLGKFNPNDSESVHRYSNDYISKTRVYKINSSTGRKNKVKPNGGEEAVVIAHCLKYKK